MKRKMKIRLVRDRLWRSHIRRNVKNRRMRTRMLRAGSGTDEQLALCRICIPLDTRSIKDATLAVRQKPKIPQKQIKMNSFYAKSARNVDGAINLIEITFKQCKQGDEMATRAKIDISTKEMRERLLEIMGSLKNIKRELSGILGWNTNQEESLSE